MKVKNIEGNHGAVKNQFEIVDDQGNIYFQSYDSIICKKSNGKVTLDRDTFNS